MRYDASGFLHWGLNQWPSDLDPNKGLFAPGDDFIVYPGRDGPRSSLRWEAFRDGVEDHALFTLWRDRKSTRLNSSHSQISYAVFCLKKKKKLSHRKHLYYLHLT